jgi:hypothetical protein
MKKETRRSVSVALALLVALAVMAPAPSGAFHYYGGWRHLGNDPLDQLNGAVYALNTDVPDVLYAGGSFYDAGGNTDADYIAAWNGQDWGALGAPPLNGAVHAIAYNDGKVYAGGVFTNAGGDPNLDFLAVWDGVAWAPACNALSGPAFGGNVVALEIIGQTLFAGGTFQDGGDIASADYLVACDLVTGAARSTVPDPNHSISGPVYTADSDSAGNLYIGGRFNNVADIAAADNVAYLAPTGGWSALGDHGVNDFVRALTVGENDDVYVSTDGSNLAGIPQADHVARWNGTAWSAMGSNSAGDNGWFSTTTYIDGMTTVGSLVFVTGSFQNANTDPRADNIAYFDGTDWHNLGSDGAGDGPWNAAGHALAVSDGKLYAGGSFTSAAGNSKARGLATFLVAQPDAVINGEGEQVFSKTGHGQTTTVSVRRGHDRGFGIDLYNSGLLTEEFLVRSTGGARGFRVKYVLHYTTPTPQHCGCMDVTDDLRSGQRYTLQPFHSLRLFMTVKVSARSARSASFLTKISSTTENGGADAIRVVVRATR